MIGPEERLMALGVPAETAREMVRIFGASGGTPLLAANNLSDLPNVQAALINLGLGALAQQSAVVTQQSSTVTPTGAGTIDSPLQASVRVSADPDNVLVVENDGLRVPASSSGIPEAPDDGGVYGRGNEAWQQLGSAALADTADFATAAQGAAADTAVQPGDLGSAAFQDSTVFATATQGGKADTAVQPNLQIASGTGLTGGGDLSQSRTLSIDKATDANVRAAVMDKVFTTDLISSALSPVTLTDAATVAINWSSFITGNVVVAGNRTIGNPTNVQTGTSRIIRVIGNNSTERSLSFGANYKGPLPEETISSSKGLLIYLYAYSASEIHVMWKAFEI